MEKEVSVEDVADLFLQKGWINVRDLVKLQNMSTDRERFEYLNSKKPTSDFELLCKTKAKEYVEKMRGCSIVLMQNSNGSMVNPFRSGYVASYYTDVVFNEAAIKMVETEYHSLREQLFNLRACGVIESGNTYLKRLDELNSQEEGIKKEINNLNNSSLK